MAMLVLRVAHILFGVFWAGSALMVTGFLEPTIRALGPDGGRVMQHLVQQQKFARYMIISSSVTVISGLAFLGHGMSSEMWRASTYGQAMMFGSLTGVIALGIGHGMSAPSAKKLAQISGTLQAAGRGPNAEERELIAALQNRMRTGGRLASVFLIITIVAMAAAARL